MKVFRRHRGFSMLEVLTAIAIIAVLVSMVLGLGKRVKIQAQERLCKSGIDIISSALDQYYDQYADFPFVAELNPDLTPIYVQATLLAYLNAEFGIVPPDTGSIPGAVEDEYASSEALYYYLDKKCPNSRKLIDKLATSLTAGGGAGGGAGKRTYDDAGGTPVLDLVRFVDPWGNPLRYTYSAGDVFPVIASAGADKSLDTDDDIIND